MFYLNRCSILSLLIARAFTVQGEAALQTGTETPQRFDKLGDPLPKNAVMRLGTQRLVHRGGGPSMIVLSKDEQIVFSTDDKWMMA